jgi:hypothetical protein
MTAPEKPLYHTTRSSSSFYNGSRRTAHVEYVMTRK